MSTPFTINDAVLAIRSGTLTAESLVRQCIDNADALDEKLGVFLTRYTESALETARSVDRAVAEGREVGPLAGIPIGIKDIIHDAEGPTTAQSVAFDPAWGEGDWDAPVVERLRNAGGVMMGKVTTMEFAIGNPDPRKPFPVPALAWDAERWAGGSSSGSGSGVAAEMFLGALGTDTSGSIRVPAAWNGVTGLKPTFGLVPKSGIVPLGFTNDHPGPMARSAADCALMLSVMAGHDAGDPYSARRDPVDYPRALTGSLAGLRIGVDRLDRAAAGGIDPAQPALFDGALEALRAAGADLVEVTLPLFDEGAVANLIIMLSEALAYHRDNLLKRWTDYGQPTRLMIAAVDALSGADYVQAQRVRQLAREGIARVFADVDVLVCPTWHVGAPKLADVSLLDPLEVYAGILTPYWDLLGVPTLAVPIGLSSVRTPLSMSIAAPWWRDDLALRTGDAFQRRTAFHLARTPLLSLA
ncbi:amidase [Amycolatopsis rhabdoformis]|uniref:Amidase n=1 Tax=Amycolatopsis rhabdoformis TaxID=1448059 RepID=A0ABZ1IJY8_9PSEU|nr:amidase [Amycolatopsis rhabdoformis]WSE34756.1 amidase [Amycolatopsis rhabdoformis]